MNLGTEMGATDGLRDGVEAEGGVALPKPFCGSPARLAGLLNTGGDCFGEADMKLGEAVIAARKLAGRGTGDCFGGICGYS